MPLIFSYGTLQQEDVQRSTFGRLLQGQRDELPGFELSTGTTRHANVTFNGRNDGRVSGTVFEITDAELAAADQYEQLAAYTRVAAMLASGKQAWVYVDTHSAMPDRAAIIAPPPLLTLICIGAGAVVDHFKPFPLIRNLGMVPRIAICVAILIVAAGLVFSSIRQFVTHKEHPSPYEPTHAIVSSGIYRFTRNPIYVGFLIVVIAAAIGFNSWWVLVSIVPLFLLLQFGVVLREEKYLSTKFGAAYDDYRGRVRRWI